MYSLAPALSALGVVYSILSWRRTLVNKVGRKKTQTCFSQSNAKKQSKCFSYYEKRYDERPTLSKTPILFQSFMHPNPPSEQNDNNVPTPCFLFFSNFRQFCRLMLKYIEIKRRIPKKVSEMKHRHGNPVACLHALIR